MRLLYTKRRLLAWLLVGCLCLLSSYELNMFGRGWGAMLALRSHYGRWALGATCLTMRRDLLKQWPSADPLQGRPLIVWYSTWFGRTMTDDFLRMHFSVSCPHQCAFSADRGLANCADVIVFHAADLPFVYHASSFPSVIASKNPLQTWLFYSMECPRMYPLNTASYANVFNVTWSYGFNADYRENFIFVDLVNNTRFLQTTERTRLVQVREADLDEWTAVDAYEVELDPFDMRLKKYPVYFMASNCKPTSGRTQLVDELSKFMNVTRLGRCYQPNCVRNDENRCEYADEQFGSFYFYLALENSRCQHYVTEKAVRNAFKRGVVPVVFGARRQDYAAMYPPGSYVFLEDFPSLSALADYLRFLISNHTAYLQFFHWRSRYKIVYENNYCSLCRSMQNVIRGHTPAASSVYDYKRLFQFYEGNVVCLGPNELARKWDGGLLKVGA